MGSLLGRIEVVSAQVDHIIQLTSSYLRNPFQTHVYSTQKIVLHSLYPKISLQIHSRETSLLKYLPKKSLSMEKAIQPRSLHTTVVSSLIIRYLVQTHKVELAVVPFDYDLKKNSQNIEWDGLFLSNDPGDPTMCPTTVESIKYALSLEPSKPIFGICLGNQLLALAAGGSTYKLKYGNRGMNQPCVDLRTGRCYITPQNHGFAVDSDSLPPMWKPLFINANDLSNEGIIHTNKPFFSVQFYPEASGGPLDTAFLFQKFVGHACA